MKVKKIKIESPIVNITLTVKTDKLFDEYKLKELLTDTLSDCIRHINKVK
jgi:hypothetical protein